MSTAKLLAFFIACCVFLAPLTAGAQTVPPQWSKTATYAPGDMVTYDGNVYRCLHAVTTQDLVPTSAYYSWELNYARNPIVIQIGSRMPFPSLAVAWAYIANARIAQSSTISIEIITKYANFDETFSAPFSLDHPNGAQITIAGDSLANIQLSFTQSSGFILDTGHAFGGVSTLQLETAEPSTQGFYTSTNATMGLISNVEINGFSTGIFADWGSTVAVNSTTTITNFTASGVYAAHNATVNIASGITLASVIAGARTDTGLFAQYGGHITAPACIIHYCHNGLLATEDGSIAATGATIGSNDYGVVAAFRGHIEVEGITASGSTYYDLICSTGGTIDATPNGSKSSTYSSSKANGSTDGSYLYS